MLSSFRLQTMFSSPHLLLVFLSSTDSALDHITHTAKSPAHAPCAVLFKRTYQYSTASPAVVRDLGGLCALTDTHNITLPFHFGATPSTRLSISLEHSLSFRQGLLPTAYGVPGDFDMGRPLQGLLIVDSVITAFSILE